MKSSINIATKFSFNCVLVQQIFKSQRWGSFGKRVQKSTPFIEVLYRIILITLYNYYVVNLMCVLQAILDVVVNLQFQMVESLWHHFWIDSKL